MVHYLIDENLPNGRIPVWRSADFVHQLTIEPSRHDFNIWRYAAERSLTIITKDTDFATLALTRTPPPRVIVLRLGAMRLRQMRDFLEENWAAINK